MSIVNKHPDGVNPLAISLLAADCITASGIAHRALGENRRNDVLLKYMEDALQRHIDLITSLRIKNLPIPRSPYPQNLTTQKGNFARFSWRNI